MRASSYGDGTETSGSVEVTLSADVAGRHVLLVEDIVDSGLTLTRLSALLLARGAAGVRVATLLDKAARRKVELVPDFVGFTCRACRACRAPRLGRGRMWRWGGVGRQGLAQGGGKGAPHVCRARCVSRAAPPARRRRWALIPRRAHPPAHLPTHPPTPTPLADEFVVGYGLDFGGKYRGARGGLGGRPRLQMRPCDARRPPP